MTNLLPNPQGGVTKSGKYNPLPNFKIYGQTIKYNTDQNSEIIVKNKSSSKHKPQTKNCLNNVSFQTYELILHVLLFMHIFKTDTNTTNVHILYFILIGNVFSIVIYLKHSFKQLGYFPVIVFKNRGLLYLMMPSLIFLPLGMYIFLYR